MPFWGPLKLLLLLFKQQYQSQIIFHEHESKASYNFGTSQNRNQVNYFGWREFVIIPCAECACELLDFVSVLVINQVLSYVCSSSIQEQRQNDISLLVVNDTGFCSIRLVVYNLLVGVYLCFCFNQTVCSLLN